MIDTPYGKAHIVARSLDGGFLVSLPKKNMTTPHPKYHGAPCVCWIYYPRPSTSDLIGRITN